MVVKYDKDSDGWVNGVGALATMVLYTTGVLEKIKNRKSKQMKIVAILGCGIVAICIIVSLILTII